LHALTYSLQNSGITLNN